MRLMQTNQYSALSDHLGKFKNLNPQIAYSLVKEGEGSKEVVKYLDHFNGRLDGNKLINLLLNSGKEKLILRNMEKFEEVNSESIAVKFINKDKGGLVLDNITKFPNLTREDVLEKLSSNINFLIKSKPENLDFGMAIRILSDFDSLDDISEKLGKNYKDILFKKSVAALRNSDNFDEFARKFGSINSREIKDKVLEELGEIPVDYQEVSLKDVSQAVNLIEKRKILNKLIRNFIKKSVKNGNISEAVEILQKTEQLNKGFRGGGD